jgi:hypothetical protein
VASDRAYVHFAGCRWISHRANDDSPVFWRIRPIWINGGNTPPRNLHIHTYHEIFDAPLPPDYPFTPVEAPDTPALLPPKGTLEGAWRDVWGSELVAVKQGIKYYYIWGTARYRDVFPDTPERVTKFCVFAGNIMGDPVMPWNEQTNKMDIAFGSYNRHNCADEDCSD